jgi:hypothetical protein
LGSLPVYDVLMHAPVTYLTKRSSVWHIGIDLHRRTVVMATVHDTGEVAEPVTFGCRESDRILQYVRRFKPFRVVIEAISTYRWLYNLLSPEGTVLLAHPAKLRLMIQ